MALTTLAQFQLENPHITPLKQENDRSVVGQHAQHHDTSKHTQTLFKTTFKPSVLCNSTTKQNKYLRMVFSCHVLLLCLFHIVLLLAGLCHGGDPFANYELEFSYITASPLGVPQQVWFFLWLIDVIELFDEMPRICW